jgi:two-component system response regulator AtoC
MQHYDWPGNIRQLENMIRSYILIGSEEAVAADLVPSLPASPAKLNTEIDLSSPISLKDLERKIILKVLEANGWSRRKTAKWLNISYRSLLYKLQETQPGVPSQTLPKKKAAVSAPSPAHSATLPKVIKPMRIRRSLN